MFPARRLAQTAKRAHVAWTQALLIIEVFSAIRSLDRQQMQRSRPLVVGHISKGHHVLNAQLLQHELHELDNCSIGDPHA